MRKHLLSFFLLVISLVCRAHDGENFVASDLFASLQPGDKAALLMVHFGTTHDDTRALTIDAINQKAKEAFKDYGDFVNHKNERIICFNVSRTYLGCERPFLFQIFPVGIKDFLSLIN